MTVVCDPTEHKCLLNRGLNCIESMKDDKDQDRRHMSDRGCRIRKSFSGKLLSLRSRMKKGGSCELSQKIRRPSEPTVRSSIFVLACDFMGKI
jgi:hypothetical protein